MPHEVDEAKRRVEEKFWSLLASRHPLTWWWWGGSQDKVNLFPEWSPTAFAREAQEWRRLSQETVNVTDSEVQHWGRFARWAAVRLSSGSYQDAADPLSFANSLLQVVELLDPAMDRYPRDQLFDAFGEWMTRITGVNASDYWRKVRVTAESKRLVHQLSHLQSGAGRQPSLFAEQREQMQAIVRQYVLRVIEAEKSESEPIPWALSAQMYVEEWRHLRHQMSQETPLTIGHPDLGPRVLHPELEHAPTIQEVVVPGLSPWWVRPNAQQTIIYHGDQRDPSLPFALVLALWHERSGVRSLSWALTPTPELEGGLMELSRLLEALWPEWMPVKTRVLAQWNQRRRAFAAVDAWLWLEDCDPDDAMKWLCRFVPKAQALSVIPWMKTHPGHYVMAQQAFDALSAVGPTPHWNHWVFRNGPVMPTELFL